MVVRAKFLNIGLQNSHLNIDDRSIEKSLDLSRFRPKNDRSMANIRKSVKNWAQTFSLAGNIFFYFFENDRKVFFLKRALFFEDFNLQLTHNVCFTSVLLISTPLDDNKLIMEHFFQNPFWVTCNSRVH